ncbi:MAG: undecaprenyl/decaprenyl-phosphate alpha-N-acetylglucosaminyl 1-phosphate transferase [Bacteroidetes bacterium]|nr:undecaprenyl/decaprenyl-phosphate alpha-N-acetylglucosaminyl 1-phosphate transferase [Bacteroidota bacterium]
MPKEYEIFFYFTFLIFSVVFAVILNSLFLKFSKNFGTSTYGPKQERWTEQKKPTLGGFSFYIVFLFSISAYSVVFEIDLLNNNYLIGLLLAVSSGFLLGLADDAYGTNPFLKFLAQFLCANILVGTGIYIPLTEFSNINYVFTVFWVIGIMNSINMIDNMDGIVTSIAICIIGGTLALLVLENQYDQIYFLILLGVFGTLLGFLYFNYYPSKMYMGDTGAQFLGIFLSTIAIIFLWQNKGPGGQIIQVRQFILPISLFIVPLIDTTTVFVSRIRHGQSPFIGGNDHLTHHLVYLGFSERQVMFFLSGITLISIFLIILLQEYFAPWQSWHTGLMIGYIFFVFIILQILHRQGGKANLKKLSKPARKKKESKLRIKKVNK